MCLGAVLALCDDASDARFSLSELRVVLRQQLRSVREQLRLGGHPTPHVMCSVDKRDERTETFCVTIPLPRSYDFPAVLRQCMRMLGPDVKVHCTVGCFLFSVQQKSQP
jgi:hypothetical protein